MSLFVKICGITDSRGLEAAVSAGADAVGFVFHPPSPRHLSVETARQLAAAVPAEVLKVAVMLHPAAAMAGDVIDNLQPDVVQTDAEDFAYIRLPESISAWPVLRENRLQMQDPLPEVFVYEGAASGAGETVDWQRAASIAQRGRMLLAGGLGAHNVAEAIERVRPWGVDVSSAVEASRGVKDPAKIREFIMAARVAAERAGSIQHDS